jgi:hypothetical protein
MKRNTLLKISAAVFAIGVWMAMKEPVPSPYAARPYDPQAPGVLFIIALIVAYRAYRAYKAGISTMNERDRQQSPPTEAPSEGRKSNWLKTIMNLLIGIGVVCVTSVMIPVVPSASAFMGFMQRLGLVDRPPVMPNKPDGRTSN